VGFSLAVKAPDISAFGCASARTVLCVFKLLRLTVELADTLAKQAETETTAVKIEVAPNSAN
jgi:hypothetical protein